MGISRDHQILVEMAVNWVERNCINYNPQLLVDNIDMLGASKPFAIRGYIPDIYCRFSSSQYLIVGDAKTPRDLDTKHSKLQMEAFISHISTQGNGLFLIATTWATTNRAKSILKRIKQSLTANSVEVLVINEVNQMKDGDVPADCCK